MSKFRKLPVVIEAFKWTGGHDQTEDPDWIRDAMAKGDVYFDKVGTQKVTLRIKTLEGEMAANQGDYIIKGLKGEIYPCKPDIFEASYEAVDVEVFCKACDHVFKVDSEEMDPLEADCPKCDDAAYTEII